MLTRDNEGQSKEEKRDIDFENLVGNLFIAEYQVDRLRTRLADLVSGYRPQIMKIKPLHMYSNTITNDIICLRIDETDVSSGRDSCEEK